MSFSIRLTAEEKSLAESYAKVHAISVGEAFKRALFERIEDEYDITAARQTMGNWLSLRSALGTDEKCTKAEHDNF